MLCVRAAIVAEAPRFVAGAQSNTSRMEAIGIEKESAQYANAGQPDRRITSYELRM
jgi:hypothetical protein